MKEGIIATRTSCRVCGHAPLTPILSLGDMYVSDFLHDTDIVEKKRYPLDLVLCNHKEGGCGLLQLKHTVSHEAMYRNYWYRSGMNKTMTDELNSIAKRMEDMVALKTGDHVLDIGANDGTLLRGYKKDGIMRIGFEPAKNLRKWNQEGTSKIIPDFFNFDAWQKTCGDAKAKAITAIAMFYDLEDPNEFVGDAAKCLDTNGAFIIQMSYLPLMLSQNAFDNICHEHLEYYSLFSLERLLARHDLEVFDVELNSVNGGSFRTYIRHKEGGKDIRVASGAQERIMKIRTEEDALGLHTKKPYEEFVARVESIRTALCSFIERENASGKKIFVYGASTKGNTLLQFFGLNERSIAGAAERNADKWGRKTIGTNILIMSEAEVRAKKPDYFLILPWHFLEEFRSRESEYFTQGGKFIVPLPQFKIIGKSVQDA